ncbi:Protein arginine N-methyltransferase PRMT10, partial [Ananas comosus]
VVLDVGTGSGILAIWSAQAGARKVYAVEATKMAEHARELAKANGVDDVVEVIEGSMEEWMGYFLLRESMFDSVICARDRWLRPDGAMYPSHARMWVAPIRSGLGDQKIDDFEREMNEWHNFVDETEAHYGVNMNALTKAYRAEHEKYYLKTSMWSNVHPNQIVGTAAVIKEIDCLTATVDEIRSVMAQVTMPIIMDRARVSAFAGWFDVHFRGSTQNPAMHEIELTTAPSEDFGTHWGQQVFLLHPPIRANEGDKIIMSFTMSRSKENHRLMNVEFTCELEQSSGKRLSPITSKAQELSSLNSQVIWSVCVLISSIRKQFVLGMSTTSIPCRQL